MKITLLLLCLAIAPFTFAQEEEEPPDPPGPAADLAVQKSGPETATAGSDVTYNVTIANIGEIDALVVDLTDNIPPGMTFVSATPGGNFTCSADEGVVVCSTDVLPVGASASFTFVFHIDEEAQPGTSFVNTATGSTETRDASDENNRGTAVTTIPAPPTPDVGVTKNGPTAAGPGTTVDYVITVTSGGAATATNVTLTDTLPGTMTFESLQHSNAFSCTTPAMGAGGTITCTIASFPAGASETFTLTGRIPAQTNSGTEFQNIATVTADDDANEENNVSSTSLTTSSVDLAVTKSGPPTVTAGNNVTYTITLTNSGADPAVDAVLTDVLPPNTTLVSFMQTSGPASSCGAGTTATCSYEVFPAGATAQYTLVIRAGDTTQIDNTATASSSSFDTDPSDNSATATTTVTPSADLAVTKSGPASATAGTNVTYVITLTNNGPSTAISVTLTDTLPAGTTFVSATQTSGPAFSCSHASGVVTCTRASLAPLAAASFDIVAAIAPGTTGSIVNAAEAASAAGDPNSGNNRATATTAVVSSADLAVMKSGSASATAGTNVTYTVTLTNNGPSTAVNVTLTDTLPANTTFVSATQTSGPAFTCAHAAGVVTCTSASFAPASPAAFTIVAAIAPNASGSMVNVAEASSPIADPNANNNRATVTTTLASSADLAVTKSGPASVTAGTNATYTVTLTNNGPSTAANVTLTDTLAAGSTLVTATQTSGPTFNCTSGTTTVTCTSASFAPAATATFQIVVSYPLTATGTATNVAEVTSSTSDPVTANNRATAPTGIGVAPADLSIAKSANAPELITGTSAVFTLVVRNHGPGQAEDVVVTDALPAGTTLQSAPGCSGTTVVTCNVGTMPAGTTATFTLTVMLPSTPGPVVNTATVTSSTPDPTPNNNAGTTTLNAVAAAPAIPTLSEWGLIVLAMALAAAVVLRR
jgi:uncharacterized repeat protein (TIGR01451 family)